MTVTASQEQRASAGLPEEAQGRAMGQTQRGLLEPQWPLCPVDRALNLAKSMALVRSWGRRHGRLRLGEAPVGLSLGPQEAGGWWGLGPQARGLGLSVTHRYLAGSERAVWGSQGWGGEVGIRQVGRVWGGQGPGGRLCSCRGAGEGEEGQSWGLLRAEVPRGPAQWLLDKPWSLGDPGASMDLENLPQTRHATGGPGHWPC